MGMKFLKAGATATEAVEASLRVLEDKEITNAGYGSNLSIDGTVECDATIVDHLGRSGACGAVPSSSCSRRGEARIVPNSANVPAPRYKKSHFPRKTHPRYQQPATKPAKGSAKRTGRRRRSYIRRRAWHGHICK
jgi:taspase (threonine aspartase 1)